MKEKQSLRAESERASKSSPGKVNNYALVATAQLSKASEALWSLKMITNILLMEMVI